MPYYFFRRQKAAGKEQVWVCVDTAQNFSEAKVKEERYVGLGEDSESTLHVVYGSTEAHARASFERPAKEKVPMEPAKPRAPKLRS